ncbi:MAG: hypothetical protein IJA75_09155, partial [Oscillospiraceae bacterium]|nr:hypothetical protein [Oscillospiraceae bacterium]
EGLHMGCKLYVRYGQRDMYLGEFKDEERAGKHFQLIKAKLESELGTDIKPVYVKQGKGKRKQ